MGSRYEVEVTITSARDLKNVNWRHGKLKPYAVVWIDPNKKCSTRADEEGDASPYWDEKLLIPFNSPIEDSTLHIDIVHARAAADEDTKPLIGSARLPLDDVGLGNLAERRLDLKRPSGRPQGKLEVKVNVREPRYRAPDPYYAAPYGVPPPAGSRDYAPPYAAPYGGAAPPAAYGVTPYGGAAPAAAYGGAPYGGAGPAYGAQAASYPDKYGQSGQGQGYGSSAAVVEEKKKSKFGGMGTGLAVGAVAGVLGGLALGEGFEALENKIADDAAERVEEDAGYDGDDY